MIKKIRSKQKIQEEHFTTVGADITFSILFKKELNMEYKNTTNMIE